jgi:hypothetical protein
LKPDQRQAGPSPTWWPGFSAGLSFKAQNPSSCHLARHEKLQLIHRLPAPFIRHLLAQFRADQLSAAAAQAEP